MMSSSILSEYLCIYILNISEHIYSHLWIRIIDCILKWACATVYLWHTNHGCTVYNPVGCVVVWDEPPDVTALRGQPVYRRKNPHALRALLVRRVDSSSTSFGVVFMTSKAQGWEWGWGTGLPPYSSPSAGQIKGQAPTPLLRSLNDVNYPALGPEAFVEPIAPFRGQISFWHPLASFYYAIMKGKAKALYCSHSVLMYSIHLQHSVSLCLSHTYTPTLKHFCSFNLSLSLTHSLTLPFICPLCRSLSPSLYLSH